MARKKTLSWASLFLGRLFSLWIFLLLTLLTMFFLLPLPGQAQSKETLNIPGLKERVEIIRDKWGIPHIFAHNEHDLFFAQGFAAAQDRLFQLELWRLKATGTLSAVFGSRFLQADIGSRLLRFRGDLETELNFYHPRSKEIIQFFVFGINAYIAYVKENPEQLPAEFRWLGLEPQPWTPEVVISRHNGLFRNAPEEVAIARAISLIGAKKVEELLPFKPKRPDLSQEIRKIRIDFSSLPAEILDLYRASRSEVTFLPADIIDPKLRSTPQPTQLAFIAPGFFQPFPFYLGTDYFPPFQPQAGLPSSVRLSDRTPPNHALSSLSSLSLFPAFPTNDNSTTNNQAKHDNHDRWPYFEQEIEAGSNNWVLAGKKTVSGKPLLANDPHRALQLPSLRTWVHLVAPGWNVIGGGEPALPGVSIGHNEAGAWGLTIFATDQEDIYVYETNPENPDEYLYAGRWEKMKVVKEKIEIKGEKPVEVDLKFTRHGPILYEDKTKHRAYALRAAWLEVGGAPYLASLRLDQARSWPEFREACRLFRTPSENLIWADRQGNIGWQAVGIAPKRKNYTGLVPVPGDGQFEWEGFISPLDLPHRYNPPEGFVATANECNLPADFPHPVGFLWAEPFRYQRIEEVLSAEQKFTLQDMASLQQDVLSLPARQLIPLLKPLSSRKESLQTTIAQLLAWDFQLKPDSVEAAIYMTWQQILLDRIWSLLLSESAGRNFPRRSLELTISFLKNPSASIFGPEPEKMRDEILLSSLEEAINQIRFKLGPDSKTWLYGQEKFHHALLRHPLSSVLKEEWRSRLDVGPLPRGGEANTVCATSGFNRQTSGATFRFIADLNDWDNALGTNCPGQSGDYRSPHYSDLFRDWAEGRYFPALFSREKILKAAERITELIPSKK